MKRSRLPIARPCGSGLVEPHILAIVGKTQMGLWETPSLGCAGLHVQAVVTNSQGLSAYSRHAAGMLFVEGEVDGAAWVDGIEELTREHRVGSVLTIAERYHAALVRNRQRFEPEFYVFNPSAECFRQATDKDYMDRLCKKFGVPVANGMTLDVLLVRIEKDPFCDPLPPGQKRISKISAAARFLWNCGPWTRDDTFWWRDPKPFLVDLKNMVRRLRERSVDLIGNPEPRSEQP